MSSRISVQLLNTFLDEFEYKVLGTIEVSECLVLSMTAKIKALKTQDRQGLVNTVIHWSPHTPASEKP